MTAASDWMGATAGQRSRSLRTAPTPWRASFPSSPHSAAVAGLFLRFGSMRPIAERRGFLMGLRVERLGHLGLLAGMCQEIGLAEYLDSLAGPNQQQVSIGTATVADETHGHQVVVLR